MTTPIEAARQLTLAELQDLIRPVKGEPEMNETETRLYDATALAGEAGEIANKVKKSVRDRWTDAQLDEALLDEGGDVLFYVHRILAHRGLTLADAAKALLDKLESQRSLRA